MNVAIIGSGGREHSIAWKIRQSSLAEKIYVLPGNGGIRESFKIDINDFKAVKDFCIGHNVGLIIIGPEVPLARGIADYFAKSKIKIFGPKREAARLESSKIWAKRFMQKYGIPTASFKVFERPINIKEVEKAIFEFEGNVVLKYDGLAAGKGVYVCNSVKEASEALWKLNESYGENLEIVFEEKLKGNEISIIGITDGKSIKLLSVSRDHKRLRDDNKGPNTGGMGAFTPVDFYTPELKKQIEELIIEPTLRGLQSENIEYMGVLYFGILIADGKPNLLEYNARFGDPETEVILPALRNDLLKLILDCIEGRLSKTEVELDLNFFIDVVAVSGGYPDSYKTGYEIKGLDDVGNDIVIFHAGTKCENGKIYTSGGRVLNIVASGNDFETARLKVYSALEKILFNGMYYRKDIGRNSL
jgi:phosphoribosylamine--glycine ligase